MAHSFFCLHTHGFIRTAVATPRLRVADPFFNAQQTIEMAREADRQNAALVLFPELGISAYALDDLLQQEALLQAVDAALGQIIEASCAFNTLLIIGAPLRWRGRLYNCALAILRGKVLAVTPKTYLPNYREFYEKRHFSSGAYVSGEEIVIANQLAPFGCDLLLEARDVAGLILHMEICEDVWVPIPPSARAALAGATVLLNLSASNAIISKSDHRQRLCAAHSATCLSAYLYSASGQGESTTDLAWDGEAMIYENGVLLAKAKRFSNEPQLVVADLDLGLLAAERLRQSSFGDCADLEAGERDYRRIHFDLGLPDDCDFGLRREIARFPFVPSDETRLTELCYEAINIQAHGLAQRIRATKLENIVIGVSGGLDSTHALLVAITAMDQLGLPRHNILAYTLPAFATTDRTKSNALALMRALGVRGEEIDVSHACVQMLKDIDHPAAQGVPQYDATYENVQAGARTSLLFRLANLNNALVVGTGDLSELALGWCTYGVGDHMSHYNVNASVPKTLIQHLIRWYINNGECDHATINVLNDILSTEISPELIPGETMQRTQDVVGPYELKDFNLFYATRYGFSPPKIAFLAWHAWKDAAQGYWPYGLNEPQRHAYGVKDIKCWLEVFIRRFFETAQFKRSAMPNGPKVSSGGSLSPRGDWRAPSDSSAQTWLKTLELIP